ncbi:ribonuclease III [Geitlerinema sp. PCC 9228]|uniref:ribonuclease III n=1 Tax=Geitlerinema sp. PCC 9228 TaxID=111611 RepID=UPI0008F9C56F|nr:ribonuclease III [Geitlerinema sp. PCC 9228]
MTELPTFQNPSLLQRALTHRSYANEYPQECEDNERLEFLGDAVLAFLVGDWLYRQAPHLSEGDLTRLRSLLVDAPQLANFASQLHLGDRMLLGKGAIQDGGRENISLLSSTFEAVVGAYYLDSGIEAVKKFIEPIFAPVATQLIKQQTQKPTVSFQNFSDSNYKGRFQQWALANWGENPKYHIIQERGPDHNKEFTTQVCVAGKPFGLGQGNSKKQAEKAAAQDALAKLGLAQSPDIG